MAHSRYLRHWITKAGQVRAHLDELYQEIEKDTGIDDVSDYFNEAGEDATLEGLMEWNNREEDFDGEDEYDDTGDDDDEG